MTGPEYGTIETNHGTVFAEPTSADAFADIWGDPTDTAPETPTYCPTVTHIVDPTGHDSIPGAVVHAMVRPPEQITERPASVSPVAESVGHTAIFSTTEGLPEVEIPSQSDEELLAAARASIELQAAYETAGASVAPETSEAYPTPEKQPPVEVYVDVDDGIAVETQPTVEVADTEPDEEEPEVDEVDAGIAVETQPTIEVTETSADLPQAQEEAPVAVGVASLIGNNGENKEVSEKALKKALTIERRQNVRKAFYTRQIKKVQGAVHSVGRYVASWYSANMAFARKNNEPVELREVQKQDTSELGHVAKARVATSHATKRAEARMGYVARKGSLTARTVARALYMPVSAAATAFTTHNVYNAMGTSNAETTLQKITFIGGLAVSLCALTKTETLVSQERNLLKAEEY